MNGYTYSGLLLKTGSIALNRLALTIVRLASRALLRRHPVRRRELPRRSTYCHLPWEQNCGWFSSIVVAWVDVFRQKLDVAQGRDFSRAKRASEDPLPFPTPVKAQSKQKPRSEKSILKSMNTVLIKRPIQHISKLCFMYVCSSEK